MPKKIICILMASVSCASGFVGCVVSPTRVRNLPIEKRYDEGHRGDLWWFDQCTERSWYVNENDKWTILIADGYLLIACATKNPDHSEIQHRHIVLHGLTYGSFWQPSTFQKQIDKWGWDEDEYFFNRWPSWHVRRFSLSLWLPMLLFSIYPLIVVTQYFVREQRRSMAHVCWTCGYNLRGNESGRCPECGHTHTLESPEQSE